MDGALPNTTLRKRWSKPTSNLAGSQVSNYENPTRTGRARCLASHRHRLSPFLPIRLFNLWLEVVPNTPIGAPLPVVPERRLTGGERIVAWNLNDYEPVEDRLRRFWETYPSGRVSTSVLPSEPGQWIVRAFVYRDINDAHPSADGTAHEVVSQRGVNATSALENCETSAIGRALANLGFAPKGARPSREEMAKANGSKAGSEPVPASRPEGRNQRQQGVTKEPAVASSSSAQGAVGDSVPSPGPGQFAQLQELCERASIPKGRVLAKARDIALAAGETPPQSFAALGKCPSELLDVLMIELTPEESVA